MCVVWIQPNRLVVVAQSAIYLGAHAKCVSTVVEGVCRARVQPNGLVVILNRTLEIPDAPVRNAPIDEGAVIVRIQSMIEVQASMAAGEVSAKH